MQTLISVFDDRAKAREAVSRLLDAGFAQADIELRETEADGRGRWVLRVDAHRDAECEGAAAILHDRGAIDVDDRDSSGGMPFKPGVRVYQREARSARQDSLLADRAGHVSKEMKEDREERAYAKAMTITTRDRPK